MSDEQDQIISECFANGQVGIDCDECEAHPVNDGECCFSTGHEYNHRDCNVCDYDSDCSQFTHGASKKRRRRIFRRSSSDKTTHRRRVEEEPERLIQLPNRKTSSNRTSEVEDQEEVFIQRLTKVTGWGMIEGGLQMALSFFQKNRPE